MEDHSQFACRTPWSWAAAAGLGGGLAIGLGALRAVAGYPNPLAPPLAAPLSAAALIGLGSTLVGLAAWMVAAGLRRKQVICLSDSEISLPRSRWSAESVTASLKTVTALRIAAIYGQQQMELVWPEGAVIIRQATFRDPETYDRLLDLLSRRLTELGVPVEDCTAAERARRRRPQFTIAWMMIAVTFVAAVLGMYSFVYGTYSWDVLIHLGITVTLLVAVPWLLLSAPRAALIFAVGFAVGFWIEWAAMVALLSLGWIDVPSIGPPGTWYPLTALLWRLAATSPWAAWLADGLIAYMIGAMMSGALVGATTLAVYRLAGRHWRRRLPPQ